MTGSAKPIWFPTAPPSFSIAACRFPLREDPNKPGPKLRPGLIVAIRQNPNSKLFACDVAYGTKNLKILQRGNVDIIVQHAADIDQFGLACATRFDLDRILPLPWNDAFFSFSPGFQTPIIGRLTESYIVDYAWKMMKRTSK